MTMTSLLFACAFLGGVAAGAWLNDLSHRPRRSLGARR